MRLLPLLFVLSFVYLHHVVPGVVLSAKTRRHQARKEMRWKHRHPDYDRHAATTQLGLDEVVMRCPSASDDD